MSATGGIGSFADDSDARTGPVSGRVALLLRSAEGKPAFAEVSQGTRRRKAARRRGRRPAGLAFFSFFIYLFVHLLAHPLFGFFSFYFSGFFFFILFYFIQFFFFFFFFFFLIFLILFCFFSSPVFPSLLLPPGRAGGLYMAGRR